MTQSLGMEKEMIHCIDQEMKVFNSSHLLIVDCVIVFGLGSQENFKIIKKSWIYIVKQGDKYHNSTYWSMF